MCRGDGRGTDSICHSLVSSPLCPLGVDILPGKYRCLCLGLQLPQAAATLFLSQMAVLSSHPPLPRALQSTPDASPRTLPPSSCRPQHSLTSPQPLARISGVTGGCGHFPPLCMPQMRWVTALRPLTVGTWLTGIVLQCFLL